MKPGTRMRRDLERMMKRLGEEVTFRRPNVAAPDLSTGGTQSVTTNSDETVLMAFVGRAEKFEEVAGSAPGRTGLRRDTRVALMASRQSDGSALVKVPEPGDELVGVGVTVKVVEAHLIRASSVNIGYRLEVAG